MSESYIDEKVLIFLRQQYIRSSAEVQNLETKLAIAKTELASVEIRLKEEASRLGVAPFEDSRKTKERQRKLRHGTKENRAPLDMIKPEFEGLPIKNVLQTILLAHGGALTAVEIVPLMYDTLSDEDIIRARKVITSYLRQGVEKYGWIKRGRGKYQWVEWNYVGPDYDTCPNCKGTGEII